MDYPLNPIIQIGYVNWPQRTLDVAGGKKIRFSAKKHDITFEAAADWKITFHMKFYLFSRLQFTFRTFGKIIYE